MKKLLVVPIKRLKVLTMLQEIHMLDFLFHLLLFQQLNQLIHPNLLVIFIIFIISFTSSFEINIVNPFPALTAPFPLIFLSNLFIALEVKLLTNPAKGIAKFVTAFFPKFF